MQNGDLYAVFGVARDATGLEIQEKYQHLRQQLAAGEIPAEQRPAIERAYDTLGDPIRRLRYDAQAAAPPPPRFQMPTLGLPNRRLSVLTPHLRAGLPAAVRGIDPMLGALAGLVVVVGLVVLFVLLRSGSKPGASPQSVADLGPTSTATSTATRPASTPTPGVAQNPFAPPGQGTGLLPLSPGLPSIVAPSPPSGGSALTQTAEPPFLTGSAIVDTLRAVIAAAAVRNGPSQGTVSPPAASAPAPITSAAPLPPIVTGAVPSGSNAAPQPPPSQSSAATAPGQTAPSPESAAATGAGQAGGNPSLPPPNLPTPPPPTPAPVPNHIAVPTIPVPVAVSGQSRSGPAVPPGNSSQPGNTSAVPSGSGQPANPSAVSSGAAAPGPNRFAPPTPGH